MRSRHALALGLALVLAGCTLPVVGNAPSYPDRPAQLNESAIVDYVEQYERAERYRELFENQGGVEFGCTTGSPIELGGGHFVRTHCVVTEGPRGSGGPPPSAYFVNETQTVRVPTGPYTWPATSTFPSSQADADSTTTDGTVFVYNLAPSNRTLGLTVESRADSSSGATFRNSTSFEPRSGFGYHFDGLVTGEYSLTARVDGRNASTTWHVDGRTETPQNVVGVVVTPRGDIRVVRLSYLDG